MKDVLSKFTKKLHSNHNSCGFFFFSGHTETAEGENYLYDVDPKENHKALKFSTVVNDMLNGQDAGGSKKAEHHRAE